MLKESQQPENILKEIQRDPGLYFFTMLCIIPILLFLACLSFMICVTQSWEYIWMGHSPHFKMEARRFLADIIREGRKQ